MPLARIFSSFTPLLDTANLIPRAAEGLFGRIFDTLRLGSRHNWDLSDKRSHLRHGCRLEAMLHSGADCLPITILDLSRTGMRIKTRGGLTPGSCISVSDGRSLDATPCRVEWIRRGQAGLSFLRPVATTEASWLVKQGGQRLLDKRKQAQALRVKVRLNSTLIVNNKVRQIDLLELGTGGATIASDGELLSDDTRVRLDFGSGGNFGRIVIDCQVVSVEKGKKSRYGLRFLKFYKGTGGELSAYLNYFLTRGRTA